jgi:hypothetical protein
MAMRVRIVPGADGRVWSVRRSVNWRDPISIEDFEHDVGTGQQGTGIILGALAILWAVVIGVLYLRSLVHVPWWMFAIAGVILLCFPVRWAGSRWRSIVAETPGGHGLPEEHWAGKVRGHGHATAETRLVIRMLRERGTPGHAHSPLHPVTSIPDPQV